MKLHHAGSLAFCFALGLLTPSHAAVNYILDDGSLNTSVGVGGSGGDLLVLNQFDADPNG